MSTVRRSQRVAAAAANKVKEVLTQEPSLKKQKKEAAPTESAAKPAPAPKKAAAPAVKELQVGDKIPDWFFLDQDEKEIHLAKLDRSIVVIFSYPKASTPGCTRQACGFRDNYNGLTSKAVILGLSADTPKAQKSFATKHGFQYSLLSDPSKKLLRALGGLKSDGKIARSHWIFVDGVLKVKKIQISPEVSYTTAKDDIEKLAAETNGKPKEEAPKEAEEAAPAKEEAKVEPKEEEKKD